MCYCTKCKIDKDDLEFYPSQRKKRGICKSCWRDCPSQNKEGVKKYKEKNKDKVKKWKQKDYNNNRKQYLWSQAKYRATDRNCEFDITLDDIKFPTVCPILDIPIIITAGEGRTGNSPSIDRIDNNRGYTKDNIIIVSDRANCLKKDGTQAERWAIYNFYKEIL